MLRNYVAGLTSRLREAGIGAPLYIFQSDGGIARTDVLMRNPALNRGHWADIGGMGPGSYSPATTDIHQEGMFIPPVKLFEAGRPSGGVVAMIIANIRNPSIGHGDLRAQYASCESAERRLAVLIARYTCRSSVPGWWRSLPGRRPTRAPASRRSPTASTTPETAWTATG